MADFYIEPPPKTEDAAPKFTIEPPAAGTAPGAAAARPPAAVEAPAQPGMLERADEFLSGHPVYNVAKTAIPPIANFLVADPIRSLAADVVGGVRSPPFGEKGREGFWQARDKSLEGSAGLRFPENETGQQITGLAGAFGSGLPKALGAASNALIGEGPTAAIAPFAQVAGDALPLIGAKVGEMRGTNRPPGMAPRPEAAAARSAGYSLPPEEISAQPSVPARLMSGESGKWKKQQAFSVDNQKNTNRLAARSIGLPPETRLTEANITKAKQPAIAGYDAIKTAAPETVLGADPTFHQAVEGVGVRNQLVEEYFPEAAHNPKVAELRNDLLQNATAPTEAVMKKVADLRFESRQNFKKRDDAQAHALGYAQRQAADVLEDAIERSVGYGPDRVTAFAAHHGALDKLTKAKDALRGDSPWIPGEGPLEAAAAQTKADLTGKLASLTPAEAATAQAAIQQFRKARQLFARIYDIESSLNPGTRDVVASRVAGLRRVRGRPLDGEMKSIADSAEAFPREMQDPSRFGGHPEDWSVLDLIGGAAAAASGHPLAAGVIAGRYPARRALGSEWMQNRMFNRQPFMSSPATGAAAGEAVMPREDDPLSRAIGY